MNTKFPAQRKRDRIAVLVTQIVELLLDDEATPAPSPAEYSTGNLPPDCPSKARFHAVVKGVAGAEKRGRRWAVPVDAWRAFRAARPKLAKVTSTPASDIELADRFLGAAGLRNTKKAG